MSFSCMLNLVWRWFWNPEIEIFATVKYCKNFTVRPLWDQMETTIGLKKINDFFPIFFFYCEPFWLNNNWECTWLDNSNIMFGFCSNLRKMLQISNSLSNSLFIGEAKTQKMIAVRKIILSQDFKTTFKANLTCMKKTQW